MKRYQITLNGRTFDVRVLSDPQQEQVEVEVDGQAFTAEVKTLSVDESEAAAVAPAAAPAAAPVPAPPPLAASPPTGTPRPVETGRPAATLPSHGVIAPLPGVIKSIAVQPGQQVSKGDRLLVIEAMKMDNVIRASREGIVEAIHVAEGRQVAHGELLLEYRR